MVLDVETACSLDDARQVATADPDGTPMLPSFDREGRLHVVRQQRGGTAPGGVLEGSAGAVVLDAETGARVSRRPLRTAVSEQVHDPTGRFLIRTFVDGSVQHRDAEGAPVVLGEGSLAAAW